MIINPMVTDATWFSSSQIGSPKINSLDPDGIIKVLDACLVTGWGEKPIIAVFIDGDLITLDYGAGHGCNLFQKLLITGADDPLLNGVHKAIAITNNTVTLRIIGVSSGSGTIKAKIAPLGWESIFGTSDTLRRAYRSLSANNSKMVVYLDMGYPDGGGYSSTSPARRAMISVCEDMSELGVQINSLTDAINNKPVNKNGALFWHQTRGYTKSTDISSAYVSWKVVGNSDFFYILIASNGRPNMQTGGYHNTFGFGEYVRLSGDQTGSIFLSAEHSDDDGAAQHASSLNAKFGTGVGAVYTMTTENGVFGRNQISPIVNSSSIYITSGLTGAPYPTSYGDFLFTSVLKIIDKSGGVKGFMPSYLTIDHQTTGNFDDTVVDGVLIVRVPENIESAARPANVGFYVGE